MRSYAERALARANMVDADANARSGWDVMFTLEGGAIRISAEQTGSNVTPSYSWPVERFHATSVALGRIPGCAVQEPGAEENVNARKYACSDVDLCRRAERIRDVGMPDVSANTRDAHVRGRWRMGPEYDVVRVHGTVDRRWSGRRCSARADLRRCAYNRHRRSFARSLITRHAGWQQFASGSAHVSRFETCDAAFAPSAARYAAPVQVNLSSDAEQRRGMLYGLAAYAMWGIFPLYWPLLKPATAPEILAHRVLWSLLTVTLLIIRTEGFAWLRTIDCRRLGLVTLASVLIGVNWMTYIWAVNSAHVVETALGYFINPLVTVLLGVAVLRERLRPAQRVALVLSGIAVVGLAIDYGHLPWIALTLAVSFALYGLVKKRAGVNALQSLFIETVALALPAFFYVASIGAGTLRTAGLPHALLLASTGVVTAIPLLCFGAAANRIPLVLIGILQYVSPTLQFVCGVAIQHEAMPASRWLGFGIVWTGLAILALDGVLALRATAGYIRSTAGEGS